METEDYVKLAAALPAYVPDVIRKRYARGELEYVAKIDRLILRRARCFLRLGEILFG